MKTLCGKAVLVLVLLVSGGPCAGDVFTPNVNDGNELLTQCAEALRVFEQDKPVPLDNPLNSYNIGVCVGILRGISTLNATYQVRQNKTQVLFCLPEVGVTLNQSIRIILHYLQAHPERLHLPGNWLAIDALRDAFPCPPAPARPQR